MKVFISWSGERSKYIGEIFNEFIPCILQHCETFFSPEMDKGIKWFKEISNKLNESEVGIICLTKSNLDEPWILFESGALSNKLGQSKVCTFLLDLEPTDVKGPLSQFNATKNNKEDIYKLFKTINSYTGNQIKESNLQNILDTWWGKMEDKLLSVPLSDTKGQDEPFRDDRDMLKEILEILRIYVIQKQDYGEELDLFSIYPYYHELRFSRDVDKNKVLEMLTEMFERKGILDRVGVTLKHNKIIIYSDDIIDDKIRKEIKKIKGLTSIASFSTV